MRWRAGGVVVAVVVLLSALVLGGSGTASADGIAQFSFVPATIETAPGGSFTVDLKLRSAPQIASGAYKVGVVLGFDPTVLRATAIERGPFMSLQTETTVETNMSRVNNERGFLIYDLARDPPKGGASGIATFATIRFVVREDAPNGTSEINVSSSRILLTDGMPQRVLKASATVAVDRDRPVGAAGTAAETTVDTPESAGTAGRSEPADPATDRPAGAAGADGGSAGVLGGIGAIVFVAAALALFAGTIFLIRRL